MPIIMRQMKGFTLLEIMLVLVLMGMISVGVVMTLPNSGSGSQGNEWQAQRFSTLLQLTQDQAIILNTEFGIQFSESSYTFATYDFSKRKWVPYINSRINGHVELSNEIVTEYHLAGNVWGEIEEAQKQEDNNPFADESYQVNIGDEDNDIEVKPHVFIMSSGEITPFSYQFSTQGNDLHKTTVNVSMNGDIKIVSE